MGVGGGVRSRVGAMGQVADDQQGVGADAFAGGVVAGWEGVVIQGLDRKSVV